jgi:hypothetical protein
MLLNWPVFGGPTAFLAPSRKKRLAAKKFTRRRADDGIL